MNDTFKGGLNLKFVANSEFESLDHVAQSEHAPIIARNALRLLMMGWPSDSWKQFISWPILKAIFVYRDPALLKELRFAFQQGFELLFTQLQGRQLSEEQNEQVQLYLSNCLSILPYSDLTPYESIKIPQSINGEWELVEYSVTPIELTPTTGFNSYFIQDSDRVFAYGLEPISHLHAQPHLIFMGTTYPAGQGFIPQIQTDLQGFETVGKSLYESGIDRIKQWLLRQKDKAHVCGVSLGGSLSLLLALHMGQHLQRVDALNPAGLHDGWYKSPYDQWDNLNSQPQVVVQRQANDPVSFFGVWKKGWQILWVNPPADKKGPNALCDHFLNYAGFAETEFTYTDPEQLNAKRRVRNFLVYSLVRSLIYYSAIIPYNYVIRPFAYFVTKHWAACTLAFFSFIGLGVLAVLAVTGTLPLAALLGALAVATVAGGIFIASKLGNTYSQETKEQDINFASLHDPSLPRNPSMDIYNKDNTMEVELTYKDINTYYKVIRGLVKEKDFIPNDNSSKQLIQGLSKKEVLLASEQPENQDKIVRITTTKAKAVHIRHVLTLVEQLGIENAHALKQAAEHDYKTYSIGKHD
ncbi:hypothetical protein [Legionella fallonii]|uniref:Uncharacterized protein n=1 Tax=Legionella fallonii LLAP-10 TaxID=1212491 RepID=A0A098G2H8_9GAMM|nr:hypothetical protein [Legionella fallonii]CEG56191.1 conserved membrane protein of unknown function [Legionella fallonii LLAP-10]